MADGTGATVTRVAIRPATSHDADQIVRAYLDSAEHHARLDPERYAVPSRDVALGRYRELLQPPAPEGPIHVILVAELEAEIVGVIEARLDRSPDVMHREMTYCHIVEIAVRSAHRSRGIGAQLLAAAEVWGRDQGAAFASLEYLAVNTRAGELYRRLGYHAASMTAIKRL